MVGTSLREKPVTIQGPVGQIEGRLAKSTNTNPKGLLVLHPHPQYGGTLSNNVVKAVIRAGQREDLTTLRINFRGVGRSDGTFDHGVGEQEEVQAAIRFLKRWGGIKTLILAGYSFGACVALAYCHRPENGVDHLFLIAPPPFLLPENLSLEIPVTKKILLGEQDQIAPPDVVKSKVSPAERNRLLEVVDDTDHFFMDKEPTLERIFSGFFRAIP